MTATRPRPGPPGPPGPVGPVGVGFRRTYTQIDGTTSSAWSTPDTAALDITGPISLRAAIQLDSFTTTNDQAVIAKATQTSNQRSYQLVFSNSPGRPAFKFQASNNGSSVNISMTSDAFPDALLNWEGVFWIRADAHPTAGSGGVANAAFYYSTDGSSWKQIGAVKEAAAAGPWFSSSSLLYVGRHNISSSTPANLPLTARVYMAEVWDASGGFVSPTLAARLDAQSLDPNTPTATYTDTTGKVWTPAAGAIVAVSEITTFDIHAHSIDTDRIGWPLTSGAFPSWLKGTNAQDVDYGAKFDNVNPDAAGIAAAIDSLPTGGSLGIGGDVTLGSGHAKLEAGLLIPNKVAMRGQGREATILEPSTGKGFPATKQATATANCSSGGSIVTLTDTSEIAFDAGDIGRILCFPSAGPGGRMTKEKIVSVESPTQLHINSRTTFKASKSNSECFIATPAVELGASGAFYTRLERLELLLTSIDYGFGVWTEWTQENSGLQNLLITGAQLCSFATPEVGTAAKNWGAMWLECNAGTSGAPHPNSDAVSIYGGLSFMLQVTVNGSSASPVFAAQGRAAVVLDGASGTIMGLHTEGYAEGVVIGEASGCTGLDIGGYKGHANQTTAGIHIKAPADGSHNTGINLHGIRRSAVSGATAPIVLDSDSLQPGNVTAATVSSYEIDSNRNVTSPDRHLFGGVSV